MSNAGKAPSRPLFFFSIIFLLALSVLASPSTSDTDSFVFSSCSQLKYLPGSPYENGVNSVLTSFVNNSMSTTYNNFSLPAAADTIYGLFQCRGDLNQSTCSRCVAHAASQIGTLCMGTSGGALQLDGCLVKYDNSTFLGLEDKTVMYKKCGPVSGSFNSDDINSGLAYTGLRNGFSGPYGYYRNGQSYKSGQSGYVQSVMQCLQDLNGSQCRDCFGEAIQQLKSNCGAAR